MSARSVILLIGLVALALLLVGLGLTGPPARAQAPAGELLGLINAARRAQGLHPYVFSAALNAAAQRHSEDMANTGQISHTGSDGSSDVQRILEAGYEAYPFGPVVGENVYGGTGGPDVPFDAWMGMAGARSNVLHAKYREAGIGVVFDASGRAFWTLTLGARPNVLPVLIEGGASSVDTITVTLTLVPENAVPDGNGTAMGQPVAYRASTDPQFVGTDEWQPWASQVTFRLDEEPGQQTVYVQLRDDEGRTTVSQASVTLVGEGAADETGTPEGTTGTPTPTGTPAETPARAGTGTPTGTATRTATTTATPRISPTSTRTATATATVTPSPSPSPSATRTPRASATASATPSRTPSPTALPTATPTVTPSPPPTSSPAPAPTETPTGVPAPTTTWAGPLPATPQADRAPKPWTDRVLPWALGLQAVALVLGIYVTLRRPPHDAAGE
jgi:hypothetical protein